MKFMTIPLFSVLIIYFIFLAGFVVFGIFNVYHALRFGMASLTNIISLAAFVAGALMIVGLTAPIIVDTDWRQPLFVIGSVARSEIGEELP